MRNRYLVLGFSLVLAVALSVPALGGPGNPVSSGATALKSTASKALKKAKKANAAAKAAQSTADQALSDAGKAQTSANSAQTSADNAKSAADAAQATANSAQSTANSAQSAAQAAQSSANAAQATADAAQASANTKFDTVTNVEGTTSASNNSDKAIIFATCPSGASASGGGFIIGGTGASDGSVIFNTGYVNSWAVAADDQGAGVDAANNWDLTPTVRCVSP